MLKLNSNLQSTQQNYQQNQQKSFIGWQRQVCADWFAHEDMPTVLFAKWMFVTDLRLLLTFEHQHCVAIEVIDTVEPVALFPVNEKGSVIDFKFRIDSQPINSQPYYRHATVT